MVMTGIFLSIAFLIVTCAALLVEQRTMHRKIREFITAQQGLLDREFADAKRDKITREQVTRVEVQQDTLRTALAEHTDTLKRDHRMLCVALEDLLTTGDKVELRAKVKAIRDALSAGMPTNR